MGNANSCNNDRPMIGVDTFDEVVSTNENDRLNGLAAIASGKRGNSGRLSIGADWFDDVVSANENRRMDGFAAIAPGSNGNNARGYISDESADDVVSRVENDLLEAKPRTRAGLTRAESCSAAVA